MKDNNLIEGYELVAALNHKGSRFNWRALLGFAGLAFWVLAVYLLILLAYKG